MDRTGTRAAGWALVSVAAAAALAMSHHPTSAHDGGLNMGIHGLLIALTGVGAYGFLQWSRLRGLDQPEVAAGLIAYLIAMFGHLGAATIDGFVVTALAHGDGAGAEGLPLAYAANQALARVGVFGASAAYLLWSTELLRRGPGGWERAVGVAGLAAGAVPVLLLATGVLRMNLSGALIIYGLQWGWMALVGLLMLRGGRPAAA